MSFQIIAYLLGVLLSVLFILVWPACMLIIDLYDYDVFVIWTWMVMIVCIVITSYLTFIPLLWEIVQVLSMKYEYITSIPKLSALAFDFVNNVSS